MKKEWIIHFSILTTLLTGLYGPLAGALISVQTLEFKSKRCTLSTQSYSSQCTFSVSYTVYARTTLGLNPRVSDPEMFLAAAVVGI